MVINRNKILGSLILVGILSIGAGVGTYAAFTAKVKSEGNKIEVATYTINNKVGDQSFPLFTLTNAIPGSTEKLTGFEAKVTGNKEMKITPNLVLNISKRNTDGNDLLDTTSVINLAEKPDEAMYFEINTAVYFGDIKVFDSNNEFVPVKDLMDTINNIGTKTLLKDQIFKILNGQVRINPEAENDYQGAILNAELTLTADDLVK